MLAPLEVIAPPSVADFVATYRAAGRPMRVRGALSRWQAIGRWSPQQLSARFGERRVPAYQMQRGQIVLDRDRGFRIVEVSLREYVDHVLSGEPPRLYLRARLPEVLPDLLGEVETPVYCERGLLLRRNLWFSGSGSVTSLHFDLPYNLVAQVHGTKRFILFPQGQRRHLAAHLPWSSTPHLARLDPEFPDLERYPEAASARGYSCTLEPGDLLFIPSRCWHYARSIEPSVSVNFWWTTAALYPLVRASDLYKRLRGLDI
jgi:lysine-specific demethylase 8